MNRSRAISARQIKAARALMDWSQEDLASASKKSISTIRTVELGKIPRITTLLEICRTIEDNGIEFTDGEGVRYRDFKVMPFRGEDSCDSFFDDVRRTVERTRDDIFLFTKDERILTRKSGFPLLCNLDRLNALTEIVPVKCILAEISKPALANSVFECRTVAQLPLAAHCMIVYGDKYANILLNGEYGFTIVAFGKTSVASEERKELSALWNTAMPVLV